MWRNREVADFVRWLPRHRDLVSRSGRSADRAPGATTVWLSPAAGPEPCPIRALRADARVPILRGARGVDADRSAPASARPGRP
jgi:hypothetical protein